MNLMMLKQNQLRFWIQSMDFCIFDNGIQSPEMAGVRVRRKSALQYIAVHPHNSSIYLDKRGIRQYVSTRWAGSSLELPAERQL